jgi:toxin-antitoxin system PIN domain toxin
MTLFFPDINVWVAGSDTRHIHHEAAMAWFNEVPGDTRIAFARLTQIGLLRLLTSEAVFGERAMTVGKAWTLYDEWLEDDRIEFHPEPRNLDLAFRRSTAEFSSRLAPKTLGDCYLVAFAQEIGATLVTFDNALVALARKLSCKAFIPG